MSASLRKRPKCCVAAKRRYVPGTGREQTQQIALLFDHLVGEQLDRVGHIKAKRPGRLKVNHKFKFGGLCDRQVGGLNALEDLTSVDADLTIHVRNIGPITHQPTGFDKLALGIGRGDPMMRREGDKLDGPARSVMSAGKRSYRPSSQWYSTITFWPST